MRGFLASAALVLILDQATKIVVHSQMELDKIVPLLGEIIRFRYIHNAGAAFGIFQGNRLLFIAISLASVAAVLFLILSGRYVFRGSRIAFGFVLGGALGNLIDRLFLREVIDFIDIGVGMHRWPTFNVADIGVTVGVLYLAASYLTVERDGGHPSAPASAVGKTSGAERTNTRPQQSAGEKSGSDQESDAE
ncbi:MAG: signal peptidase II [Candidatus Eisenbacteria sp.]|nr:signal peptidase II [Candidatus Eisenbacteria bacterium]